LDQWRLKVAKFDDESPEYVLPADLIHHIEASRDQISHSQDLLNVVADFYSHHCGFVPFFVKVYQNELADLILEQGPKIMDANELYKEVLTNKEITSTYLQSAFKNEDAPAVLDKELNTSLVLHPKFLNLINVLN
jgi:thymidylate synthase ThyX